MFHFNTLGLLLSRNFNSFCWWKAAIISPLLCLHRLRCACVQRRQEGIDLFSKRSGSSMAGKCFERCLPASPSLWLPQTKGPALSAATQQATKGSLSERHKERKEGNVRQALALRGFSLLMPIFLKMHPEVRVDSPTERLPTASATRFRAKWKTCGWNRTLRKEKASATPCCRGLLACYG